MKDKLGKDLSINDFVLVGVISNLYFGRIFSLTEEEVVVEYICDSLEQPELAMATRWPERVVIVDKNLIPKEYIKMFGAKQ